jgi:hypothetical protein
VQGPEFKLQNLKKISKTTKTTEKTVSLCRERRGTGVDKGDFDDEKVKNWVLSPSCRHLGLVGQVKELNEMGESHLMMVGTSRS